MSAWDLTSLLAMCFLAVAAVWWFFTGPSRRETPAGPLIPVEAETQDQIRHHLDRRQAVRLVRNRYAAGRADATSIVTQLMAGKPRPTSWREAFDGVDDQVVPRLRAVAAEEGFVAAVRRARRDHGLSLLQGKRAIDELTAASSG